MTVTIGETDTDTIAWLDFEYAPGCEWGEIQIDDECDCEAEWKIVLSCCADLWLVCPVHKDILVNFITGSKLVQHNPELGGCGARGVKFALVEHL